MKLEISTCQFVFKVKDLGTIVVLQKSEELQTIHIICEPEKATIVTHIQHPARTQLTAELAESVIKMREEKIYIIMTGLNKK